MKSRVFFVLSLVTLLNPASVLADENRDASELASKVKCRETALKEFKSELPKDFTVEEVLRGSKSSKSGEAV